MESHSTPEAAWLEQVAPGIHVWRQPDGSWWINNAGVVVDGREALIVDTCATATRTRRFLDAVEEATPATELRFAVNTHQHGDHCYGNEQLPRSTVLFGHAHMRDGLASDPVIDGCPPFWSPIPDWGVVGRRLPDVAIDDGAVLYVGSRRVELLHPGFRAHTTGDLAVWIPADRVLFAGDLVFSGEITPLVAMGSVAGARAALDWIERRNPHIVVPGHGPVLVGDEIAHTFDALRRYYDFVLSAAESGVERGWSPLETARATSLGEFALWGDSERLVLNLHRAYVERVDGEVDIQAAFADAVTLLGGPMRTAV
jgi:cyclase